jgi:hypothetical protein
MKLLLSVLLTGVLVAAPVSAEAKPSRAAASSCTGWKTVEIRHSRKVVKAYIACPAKKRPAPIFAPVGSWA